MSAEALAIFNTHLAEQLGENGVFTESGVYDPDGDAVDLTGVFDDHTFKGSAKDGGNNNQQKEGARFIVASMTDFDLYDNKQLFLSYRNKTYTIEYVERDESGAQVLWLY